MATRTLVQLATDVRQVANVQNNSFVDDTTELYNWINTAVGELYDLVVSTGEGYYESAFSFSLAGGQSGNSQSLAALTGGFYKENSLEIYPGTSNMRVLRRLGSDLERDGSPARTYEIKGTPNILYVFPPEQSAAPYRLLYTPDPPVLTTGGGAVDLDSTLTRWYRFIVYRAAVDVHRKRKKLDDLAVLAGDPANPMPGTLAYERQRVLSMARNKQGQPQQVPMAKRRSSFWDWDDTP